MADIRDVMHILKAGGLDLSEQWDMTPVVTGATAPDQTKDLGGVSTVVSPGELSFSPFTAADTDPGAVIAPTELGFLAGSHSQQLATTGVSQISVIIPDIDSGDNFSTEGFQLVLCFLPITATVTEFISAAVMEGTIGGALALIFPATGEEGVILLDNGVAIAPLPQVLPSLQPGDKVTFGYNNLTTELTLSVNEVTATVLTTLDLSASPMIGFIGAVFSQEKAIFANAPLAYSFGMTSAAQLPAGAASGKAYIVSAAGSFNGKKGEVGDIAIITAGGTDVFFIRNIPDMAALAGGGFTKEANIYLGYVNKPKDRRYASWETAHAAAQELVATGHIVNFHIDYSGEDYTIPAGKWSLAGIRFKEDPRGFRLGAKLNMAAGATFIPWNIGRLQGTSLGITLADLRHLYINSSNSNTYFVTYSPDDITEGSLYFHVLILDETTRAFCSNGTDGNSLIKNELTGGTYSIYGVAGNSNEITTSGGFWNMDYINSAGSVDWTVSRINISSDFELSLGKQASWSTMAMGLGYADTVHVTNRNGIRALGTNTLDILNSLKNGGVIGAVTQTVTVENTANSESIDYKMPGAVESITVKEALDNVQDSLSSLDVSYISDIEKLSESFDLNTIDITDIVGVAFVGADKFVIIGKDDAFDENYKMRVYIKTIGEGWSLFGTPLTTTYTAVTPPTSIAHLSDEIVAVGVSGTGIHLYSVSSSPTKLHEENVATSGNERYFVHAMHGEGYLKTLVYAEERHGDTTLCVCSWSASNITLLASLEVKSKYARAVAALDGEYIALASTSGYAGSNYTVGMYRFTGPDDAQLEPVGFSPWQWVSPLNSGSWPVMQMIAMNKNDIIVGHTGGADNILPTEFVALRFVRQTGVLQTHRKPWTAIRRGGLNLANIDGSRFAEIGWDKTIDFYKTHHQMGLPMAGQKR